MSMNSAWVSRELQGLLARVNRPRTAQWPPRGELRFLRWDIEGASYFWAIESGGVSWAELSPAHCTLRCSGTVLRRLACGAIPFFLAIWATGEVQFEGTFSDAFGLGYLFLGDQRSRRVLFLAHCFLNMNTRFPEGAEGPGAHTALGELLLQSGVGIVQMPCPEFLCLGLEKTGWGVGSADAIRGGFRRVAEGVADQVAAYLASGYEVVGIIGMNPSPSCGVEVSKGKDTMLGLGRDLSERTEPGVFIEELTALLRERALPLPPIFGVRRVLAGEGGLTQQLQQVRDRIGAMPPECRD